MALVTVAHYLDPPSAYLARALLEAHGIDAFVTNEHYVANQWWHAQAVGGVEVRVDREQAVRARSLLEEPPGLPDDLEWDDAEDAERERCPSCGDVAVELDRLDRRVRAFGMVVGVPVGLPGHRYHCQACGHRWRDVPRHRGFWLRLVDLVVFFVGVVLGIVGAFVDVCLRWAGLRARRLECWACGTPFEEGESACGECGVRHPPVAAFDRVIEPGKRYDATCARCHTPYLTADYAGSRGDWRCSHCGAEIGPG